MPRRIELEHMIRASGLAIEQIYGDFHRNDFTDEAEEMICAARNARE